MYGGFDNASPSRKEDDHRAQAFMGQQQTTQAARDKIETEHGSRFTSLMHLEYFNSVRFHIIDPMHNLFLGTAKHMVKCIWLNDENPKIPKSRHAVLQSKLDRCLVPSSVGRIPYKIASYFSSFTADQWKL